jgi:alkanesulfonate monooxygenase SsuD/methylene tetrahydromethanopterin reductase-like flavin-dependent oxidoreductase (luciferase family)
LVEVGYTMIGQQRSPKDLVNDLIHAEQAGFDFSVISDHFLPCLEEQGHSGYAWSILGAAAQATGRIALMSYVSCPIVRYPTRR